MHSSKSYPTSPRGSLSTLSSMRGGYVPLSCEKPRAEADCNDFQAEDRNTSNERFCLGTFFSFLYRFLVAFLRLLCFRLPRNIDNESLLTVEYKTECKGEELECRLIEDDAATGYSRKPFTNSARASFRLLKNSEKTCRSDISPPCHVTLKPKTTAIAVNKIKASQIKGQVIASKGKDQMYKTRIAVSRSKQQLREVQDDMLNIRDNIETAKKLFVEVEKGIKNYRWESVTREPWASIEYRGEICYFPISSSVRYLTPMEQMYIDHRIFVEEMKFHFKWNHGILL